MLSKQLPGKRYLLLCAISAVIALLCTISILLSLPIERDLPPPPSQHDVRPEQLCRIPASPAQSMPAHIASVRPHIRLQETPSGQYVLHFWGNPVRPRYAFSIRKVSDNTSVLRSPQGKPLKWLPLPVTSPRREDKQLPLQPPVLLPSLPGLSDTYFAARITIHDATTGKVLCSEIYLLHGANRAVEKRN